MTSSWGGRLAGAGPVGLSALLFVLALAAARRALASPGGRAAAAWARAAGAGLALFLGLWTKLVFAWWLPAFVVFALEETRRQRRSLVTLARRRAPALLAGALAALLPTVLLLASTDRDGRPYAAVLWRGNLSAEPGDVEAVAVRLVRYVTDGSLAAPRNLALPSWPVDLLPLLLSVCLLAAAAHAGAGAGGRSRRGRAFRLRPSPGGPRAADRTAAGGPTASRSACWERHRRSPSITGVRTAGRRWVFGSGHR